MATLRMHQTSRWGEQWMVASLRAGCRSADPAGVGGIDWEGGSHPMKVLLEEWGCVLQDRRVRICAWNYFTFATWASNR